MDLGSALELEAVTQALLMKSEDHREFYKAWTEGRAPSWKGTMSSHNRIFNSPDLALPSGFAHAVVAGTTVYLGGQTAQRPDGSIEASTLAAQFDSPSSNLITALRAAGGEPDDLVIAPGVRDRRRRLSRDPSPSSDESGASGSGARHPAMGLFGVARLFDEAAQVELMGVAELPRE